MAKMITARELSEILNNMLVGDDGPDSKESFENFLKDIAEVVCNYAGGEVGNASYSSGDGEVPDAYMVSIHANDSLPTDGGVWKKYDPDVTFYNGEEFDGGHRSICHQLYQRGGQSAVEEYASAFGLKHAHCEPCEADTPTFKGECLVCGTPNEHSAQAADTPVSKFTTSVRLWETEDDVILQIESKATQEDVVEAVERSLLEYMVNNGYASEDDSIEVVTERGYDLNGVFPGWHMLGCVLNQLPKRQ